MAEQGMDMDAPQARPPKIEVYMRDDRKWVWRLKAANGHVVATDGGQGYERPGQCADMAVAVVEGEYGDAALEILR